MVFVRPEVDRGGLKLQQRFSVGLLLGREDRTGSVLVATRRRTLRSPNLFRLPVEEQFDRKAPEGIAGVPWDPWKRLLDPRVARFVDQVEPDRRVVLDEPVEGAPFARICKGSRRFIVPHKHPRKMAPLAVKGDGVHAVFDRL